MEQTMKLTQCNIKLWKSNLSLSIKILRNYKTNKQKEILLEMK